MDVYVGPGGVLSGAARLAQEAREEEEHRARQQEIERLKLDVERKRKVLEAQVEALHAQFEAEEAEILRAIKDAEAKQEHLRQDREKMALKRQAKVTP